MYCDYLPATCITRARTLTDVRTFTVILLVSKIGFIANDAVTGFKLMEKGFNV